MIRPIYLLWAALTLVVGTGLFLVAYAVDERQAHLAKLHEDIRKTTETIHILKAEWAYLNDPSRLDQLSDDLLGLKPIRPDQFTTIAALPDRLLPAPDRFPSSPSSTPSHSTPPVGNAPLANDNTTAPAAGSGAEAGVSPVSAPLPMLKPTPASFSGNAARTAFGTPPLQSRQPTEGQAQ